MAHIFRNFSTKIRVNPVAMLGKKLTKRQSEAARKNAEREAEFRLKCSIIDEIKEYPVLYDKVHPNHFRRDHKEEVYK